MSPQIDELRPPTAARLLTIRRTCREMADDPLERVLLCNAHILTECCFFQGEPAFADETAVLEALTGRQMEHLLRQLAGEPEKTAREVNPGFDEERFRQLGGV